MKYDTFRTGNILNDAQKPSNRLNSHNIRMKIKGEAIVNSI